MKLIYSIVISFDDISYQFTGKDIIDIEYSERLLNDTLLPEPGICTQYAKIRLYDRYNLLHQRALENKSMQASISINLLIREDNILIDWNNKDLYESNDNQLIYGTPVDTNITEGMFISSEWSIKPDDKIVETQCTDSTEKLESILVPKVGYADRSLNNILIELFAYASNYKWTYLDSETASFCNQIVLKNSWYKSGSLKDLLNKVCIAGMLRIMYKNGVFYVGRCLYE